jgi:hypothetical protein
MGHAEHFLHRLNRIQGRELELALRLYHHPELVQATLERARIPESADRVAISIDDPREGPFVVVTRSGAFVTCLGRGMRTRGPVVTRTELDRAARHVNAMREELAQAEYLERNGTSFAKQVFAMLDAGPNVSREQFESVARWTPLMGRTLYGILLDDILAIERHRRIGIVRRLRRDRSWARLYRRLVDAFGNLFVLVGDSARCNEVVAQVHAKAQAQFSYSLTGTLTDVSPVAHRALWASARWGKALFHPLRRSMRELADPVSITDGLLAITAMAHARPKQKGAAVKTIAHTRGHPELTERLTASLEDSIACDARAVAAGRRVCVELAQTIPSLPRWEIPGDVPPDVARAMLLRKDEVVIGNDAYVDRTITLLPWLSRAKAPELFLPQSILRALRTPWDATPTMKVIERARLFYGIDRRQADDRPGRNAECPCESGRKFKYCCLRAA